jgi:hypothetical protein
MKRKRRDIRQFAFIVDPERDKEIDRLNNLLDRYGFVSYYDSTYESEYSEEDKQLFLSVVSSYKSLEEYKKDLSIAYSMIDMHTEIPLDLDTRLVKTKEELDRAGIREKYTWI